jgi:RNA polymerase sigma factor (sigma-70 family)
LTGFPIVPTTVGMLQRSNLLRPGRVSRDDDDDRLVARVRAGDDRAFEVLFERHYRPLLSFCRHMLGHADEAEDAVQQTFIRALAGIRGERPPREVRAWLYAIARNRCLTLFERRREIPDEEVDGPPTEGLAEEVQRREDLRELLRDVGELPEEQRAALVLAEIGGVSHDEIAQVVGVPREKVKALVFQARSSLIASREARDAPCEQIRVQLAELRGGALRRNTLRRHLKSCPGCRQFRAALQDQR